MASLAESFSSLVWWKGSPSVAGGLELGGLKCPFQSKPFHGFMKCVRVVKIKAKLDPDGQTGRQIPTQSTFLQLWVRATAQKENASDES